jgi:hypothetical protein
MVIVYPLGNSDIQTKSGTISPKEFRRITEETWNWIKDNKDKVIIDSLKLNNQNGGEKKEIKGIRFIKNDNQESYYFPILSEVYNEFISKEKGNNNAIYFIYTDQKDEKVNKQDTIYEFEIIRYLLKELIKSGWAVEPLPFEGDPTDIENALKNIEKIRKYVLSNKDSLNQGGIKVIYGPGVPTVNYSLILRFFDVADSYADFYYARLVRIGESQATKLTPTPIYGVISPLVLKNALKGIIAKYNYIAAYNFLSVFEKLQSIDRDLAKINSFFEVIYYYMLFRFNEAKDSLDKIKRMYYLNGNEEELHRLLTSELEPLMNYHSDEVKLLVPLINIMQIYFESGMFNEWISLVFRLEEEFGKLVVEKLLGGKKIEKDESGKFRTFKEAIESDIDLEEYLNKNKIRYDEPNRVVYKTIIEYYKKEQNLDRFDKDVISAYNELMDFLDKAIQDNGMKLSDLRNNSPFAHGFTGISEQLLKKHTQDASEAVLSKLVDLSSKLLKALSNGKCSDVKLIKKEDFIFNKINKLLEEVYLE